MNRTANLGVPYILRRVAASSSKDSGENRHPTLVMHLIYSVPFSPSNNVEEAV
jgi:hypothetical protein